MQAAVLHPGNIELTVEEVPIPTPGPDQVLLKVAAAGVCHSDTFILSAALPDSRSYILGHENVGYATQWVYDNRHTKARRPLLTGIHIG